MRAVTRWLKNIGTLLLIRTRSSSTFQPVREILAILALLTLALAWYSHSTLQTKTSEAWFWTSLVLIIGSESYAKDE